MSKIQWTEQTWNPAVGCSILSPGCTNCYAMRMAARLELMSAKLGHYQGLTKKVKGKAVWTGKLALASDAIIDAPLRRKKPTIYFVNSMSDLFHEDMPLEWIDRVWNVMVEAHRANGHIFQVLTKRPSVMRRALGPNGIGWYAVEKPVPCPEPGIWLGTSVERQKEANERIPELLMTPATVRFLSVEPLLEAVDLTRIAQGNDVIDSLSSSIGLRTDSGDRHIHFARHPSETISWTIVGGESGAGARPFPVDAARAIVKQCKAAGVPVFVKQMGSRPVFGTIPTRLKDMKGGDMSEWPIDLQVRQMPPMATRLAA